VAVKVAAPSSGSRLPGIEGLRAVAACAIVLVHVWGFSMPGHVILGSNRTQDALSMLAVGVTLFFTLSGFLLYRPFAASIARGTPHLPIRAYLRNRFLRIAPAYWAILAVTLAVGALSVRHADGSISFVGRLADPLSLAQSALLLMNYHPSSVVIGIGPAWSLAVEVVFYCLLPVLVLAASVAARRMRSRGGRVLVLVGPPLLLLLVGLSGKYAAHLLPGAPADGYSANWHSVIERSFWAQADLFTFGMLVAVLHTEVVDGTLSLPRHWRRFAVGLAVAVFLPCAWTIGGGEQSYLPQNTGEALALGVVLATIVVPAGERRPLRLVRLLESPVFVAVGVASYSLYLWHFPVTVWLAAHGLTLGGGWGALLVNLAEVALVAGVLSALSYRLVERPAMRRKRSTRGLRSEPATAAITTPEEVVELPATSTASAAAVGTAGARASSPS
jgi:peptidoglycan/LPS O-acetylase OafA/YrhL